MTKFPHSFKMTLIAFKEIINSSSSTENEKRYSYTILLIHGLLGSVNEFADFAHSLASSLSADWRIVLVDLRNHGNSADKESLLPPHDIVTVAKDVANLFISLNWDWPDVVIGHSLGGKVALQYALNCENGDYGDSTHLPKQVWVLDIVPGRLENRRIYEDFLKLFRTLKTIPSPIPSQEWFEDHMINLGFSKSQVGWITNSLKKSGEHETFSFSVDGVIEMFISAMDSNYWSLVENVPKGMEITIVRTESQFIWDPLVVERIERLASREPDGSTGKVSVHVVPRSGHWIHKDQPQILLEIMTPIIASLGQPKL